MTHRWLVLNLEAPLVAFGGVVIDQVGPTRDFPGLSMMTGLLANALGWHWSDGPAHQSLQDRLVMAARLDDEAAVLTDVQNAKLAKSDKGWTTRGAPEGRAGATYDAPHRRSRDYLTDLRMRVVLRLAPADGATESAPTLETVAAALDRPARPLFIGRKPCLPAAPLLPASAAERWITAATAHAALCAVPPMTDADGASEPCRALWPLGEGPESGDSVWRVHDVADLRNWQTGLHGGARPVVEGAIAPEVTA